MGFCCNLFGDATVDHRCICGNEGVDASARDTSLQNILYVGILELPPSMYFGQIAK
jgi:hypothetical protein